VNFRHWQIDTKNESRFNLLELPGTLRAGWSLPEEGTRVFSHDGEEIFHNDLVQMDQNTYWVRYHRGAYVLELIEAVHPEAHSCWLHEAVADEKELRIVGNSHSNSDVITRYWLRSRT
jgi:hypothetical protein